MTDTQRHINKLNQRLGETFGFVAFGNQGEQPKCKWVYTTEMEYWVRDGQINEMGVFTPKRDIVAVGNILATVPIYKRESWARMYGPCWIAAIWKPPISERSHFNLYGGGVPWAPYGDWQPLENMRIKRGKVPSEDANYVLIHVLKTNLGMTFEDHKREGEAINQQVLEEKTNRIGEEMDDMLDAPTLRVGKGSVSFGGI